jgi:cytochrome c oxidase cbb3-type subunit I/II
VYDHPFLWGSRRTGPDLAGEAGRNTDQWHYTHFLDPQVTSPGSIMPPYPWLHEQELDISLLPDKIIAMRDLGVPYPEGYETQAEADLWKQARELQASLKQSGIEATHNTKVIALIAYMQRLGRDIRPVETAPDAATTAPPAPATTPPTDSTAQCAQASAAR